MVHPACKCLRIAGEFVICTGIAAGALARRRVFGGSGCELNVRKPRHVHTDRFPGLGRPHEHTAPSCADHARAAFPAARRTNPASFGSRPRGRGRSSEPFAAGFIYLKQACGFAGIAIVREVRGKKRPTSGNQFSLGTGAPGNFFMARAGPATRRKSHTVLAHIARIRRVPSDMMPSMGSSMFPQVAACARPWSRKAP